MYKIKPIKKNFTIENVRNSNYWDLIAILVWNHYSDKEYQNEKNIEISESWYGQNIDGSGSSHSLAWNDPNYTEENCVRTLGSIVIKFTRYDFITYISLRTNGNISCYGNYTDNNEKSHPTYRGASCNLDITNWLLKNKFLKIKL